MNSSDNGNPKNQTPGKKKSRRGGARPGAGRKKGSVEPQTLAIRAIARSITLGNPKVVARLNRESELGTINHSVFINLMDRGFGRPIPMEAEAKEVAPSVVFVSMPEAGVHAPWCYAVDRSRRPKSDIAIIHEGPCLPDEPNTNAIQAPPAKALEKGNPPGEGIIDATVTKPAAADKADEPEGELLELVRLPEPPEPFNPGIRERDRGR
jgi:hypothetical protein